MIEFIMVTAELTAIGALLGMILVGIGYLVLPSLYLLGVLRSKQSGTCAPALTLPPDDLPEVLVQLPVFNEPAVVTQLLDAVAALDWPRDKLHIQLLDDSSDHTVAIALEKIAQLKELGYRIDHIRRDHRNGFKAAALAEGLARSTASFIAVLDADFRPPTRWLRAVVPLLASDSRAGFVQSRCEFANATANWLTRAQGLLFDTHFVMEQAVRARAGLLFQFNGTAGVWRRQAIEDAGGWSADSLCEDLDLTIRGELAGWHGLFSMNPAVSGLVPDRIGHWRVQQRRWAMGFAQIARKLMAMVWSSEWSFSRRLSAGFLLLYQTIFPLTVIAVAAGSVAIALHGSHLSIIFDLMGIVAFMTPLVAVSMTLPPYLELRRGSLAEYVRTLATLPPLVLYLAFANVQPMLVAFLGGNDAFHRTPKEPPPVKDQTAQLMEPTTS